MIPENNMQLVELVENMLGLVLHRPLWKSRRIEAGKLARAMAKDPSKYTYRSLAASVEWMSRHNVGIQKTILEIFRHVDRAAPLTANVAEVVPLTKQIDAALDAEYRIEDDQSASWRSRLHNALGSGRQVVLDDWNEAGRGAL